MYPLTAAGPATTDAGPVGMICGADTEYVGAPYVYEETAGAAMARAATTGAGAAMAGATATGAATAGAARTRATGAAIAGGATANWESWRTSEVYVYPLIGRPGATILVGSFTTETDGIDPTLISSMAAGAEYTAGAAATAGAATTGAATAGADRYAGAAATGAATAGAANGAGAAKVRTPIGPEYIGEPRYPEYPARPGDGGNVCWSCPAPLV